MKTAFEAAKTDQRTALSFRDEAIFQKRVALQEELDWQCYRCYGLTESQYGLEFPVSDHPATLPALVPGQRAFEIVMARQRAAGTLETTWFERHGSTPITHLPGTWPQPYRQVITRRIERIEPDRNLRLIEQPENKRRWNRESWAERQTRTLGQWLLQRLEAYFFQADRMLEGREDADPKVLATCRARFPEDTEPALVSKNQSRHDPRFQTIAALYRQRPDFDLPAPAKELVLEEAAPFLPEQRYKATDLPKRQAWDLQRQEDAIEQRIKHEALGIGAEALKATIREAQQKEIGDIPVPPKYTSADFKKSAYWKLRGKLDAPKERWVLYPGAERDTDHSPVIAWAGWNPLQQAQAVSAAYLDRKEQLGWPQEKLKPLLQGLQQLLPWPKQWHNEIDPDYGVGMGDYFEQFVEEE
ncbi:MAG: hypothetical protein R3F19_29960 [Verrucomicrobiales bacterium]